MLIAQSHSEETEQGQCISHKNALQNLYSGGVSNGRKYVHKYVYIG